jgi:CrcB protein
VGEEESPDPLVPSRDELPVDPDVVIGDRIAQRPRPTSLAQQARQVVVSRWDILLVIALGGALGSLARWGVGEAFTAGVGRFPWATFVVNVTGSLALGVLMVLVVDAWPPSRYVRPFAGVGVLGGYTTFSTYLLDTRNLIDADRGPLAMVYLFGSLAVGVTAVWLGIAATRLYVDRGRRRSGST